MTGFILLIIFSPLTAVLDYMVSLTVYSVVIFSHIYIDSDPIN